MLKADSTSPRQESALRPNAVADLTLLSRQASTISSSSSDHDDLTPVNTPPRPLRDFAPPRSRSPHGRQRTPTHASRPPSHLTRELAIASDIQVPSEASRPQQRSRSRNAGVSVKDFVFGDVLGEGSYSTVTVGTHQRTGQQYAIKELAKAHVIRYNKMDAVMAEKKAIIKLENHPGIIRLYFTFQDNYNLYFVLDLARNGELQVLLSKMGSLNVPCARYFAAQLVDVVGFMHSKNVIHRDIKPENMLLDDNFNIKLTDFGTAKILDSDNGRANTWVGTAQYVPPELLESKITCKSSDLWAIGCVIFQMIAGRFAFHGLSEFLIFTKIKNLDYTFPDGFDEDAKDLVQKLLVANPDDRLGAGSTGSPNDVGALRSHPFFTGVEWDTLWLNGPPPLEAGLVKKEASADEGQSQKWEKIASAWDEIVAKDDGVEWESSPPEKGPIADVLAAEGPALSRRGTGSAHHGSAGNTGGTNTPNNNSVTHSSPASAATSTDAELVDRLQDMSLDRQRSPDVINSISDAERMGRNQMITPIQGYGSSSNADLLSVLDAGEKMLFKSSVEARTLRRRASKLLARASIPQIKPKIRELILTDQRLVCVKLRHKSPSGAVVKQEFALSSTDKSKDRVVSVEAKGDRDFVIMTPSKSYNYVARDSDSAAAWIRKVNTVVEQGAEQRT